ncbi:putative lipid II flippase FtsW [Candidatus Falkowbacteria bacterium]|nr:putative lipid II flippase FtsW [Candidatus Falkowbacteria bacterium]
MAKLAQKIRQVVPAKIKLGDPDWPLLIIVAVIILFGLIMLTSASGTLAYSRYKDGYYFIKHQIYALFIGAGLFWFFFKTDYHRWQKNAMYLLLTSIAMLLMVFVPGLASSANSKAHSWINIFGFSLQPSEFVKLFFLIYVAAWLESRGKTIEDFSQGTAPFLVVLAVIAGLMLMQPDVGTLSIIVLTSFVAWFIGGGRLSHIFGLTLIAAIALLFMFKSADYRMQRFQCYLNPEKNSRTTCYQLNQSLIAVGSGGIFGRGFGASRQKLMYLPEVSGDAIFPIIGEEMGFIFSSALVLLFIGLFYRSYLIAKRAPDQFGRVLAIGIASWLTLQAFINIGGMISLIPMTGVPLPFISSGGSAVMAGLSALGLLMNISRQVKTR